MGDLLMARDVLATVPPPVPFGRVGLLLTDEERAEDERARREAARRQAQTRQQNLKAERAEIAARLATAEAQHRQAVEDANAAACKPPDPGYVNAVAHRNELEVKVLRLTARLAHVEAEAKRR